MVRNELGNPLRNWKKWINQAMKVFGVIATIEIAQRLKGRSTCVGHGRLQKVQQIIGVSVYTPLRPPNSQRPTARTAE